MLTLGARNLGGAILDHFLAQGWNGAAVARSDDTLAAVRDRGALAIAADASDPGELERAMAQTRAEHGSLDLVVNAVTASRPPASGGPWGGGPIADATIESPKTAERTAGAPPDALGDMALIAQAVQFLAEQEPRAYTHELMVTPAGETWVP